VRRDAIPLGYFRAGHNGGNEKNDNLVAPYCAPDSLTFRLKCPVERGFREIYAATPLVAVQVQHVCCIFGASLQHDRSTHAAPPKKKPTAAKLWVF